MMTCSVRRGINSVDRVLSIVIPTTLVCSIIAPPQISLVDSQITASLGSMLDGKIHQN